MGGICPHNQPVADEKNRHTVFAAQAIGLADMFHMMFAKVKLEGGGTSYVLELSTPEGESTGGGKQALQHIRLAPEGGGATLTAGSVHSVDKKAELRTFSHMATLFADRFKGAEFPIDRGPYDEVITKLQTFFTNQRYQFVLVELARRPEASAAPSTPRPAAPSTRPTGKATRTASSADLEAAVPSGSSPKGLFVIIGVAVVVVVVALLLLKR